MGEIISIKDVYDILKQHRLYLHTNGKEGKFADLPGWNLIGVNLTNANLNGANLTGADLTSADFVKLKGIRK